MDPGHVNGDLSDPQSWNGYAYASNNPLRFVDPTGNVIVDTGYSDEQVHARIRAWLHGFANVYLSGIPMGQALITRVGEWWSVGR